MVLLIISLQFFDGETDYFRRSKESKSGLFVKCDHSTKKATARQKSTGKGASINYVDMQGVEGGWININDTI